MADPGPDRMYRMTTENPYIKRPAPADDHHVSRWNVSEPMVVVSFHIPYETYRAKTAPIHSITYPSRAAIFSLHKFAGTL